MERPQSLAHMVSTYADGSLEIITDNDTWKVTYSPILESDMLIGESYDVRRELAAWDHPEYEDARW